VDIIIRKLLKKTIQIHAKDTTRVTEKINKYHTYFPATGSKIWWYLSGKQTSDDRTKNNFSSQLRTNFKGFRKFAAGDRRVTSEKNIIKARIRI